MNATRLPLTNALHIYYAISMEETTTEAVRRALADGLQTILSIPAEPRDIRLPSRIAAAATPLAIAHGADTAAWAVLLSAERSRFPALYGAPLVSYATAENGWLLFTLTSDFYSAAVMHTRSALPFPSRTDTYALLLSARSGSARVCLTEESFENPETPPSFCMLMRKHLTGGKLLDVHMEPGDRIVYFDFQCTNEMGDLVRNTLCAELMGRYSNLVLVQNGKIIDALKRVDFEDSDVRQLLPGLPYTTPPKPARPDFLLVSSASIVAAACQRDLPVADALNKTVAGVGPVVCREAAWRAFDGEHLLANELTEEQKRSLMAAIDELKELHDKGGRARNRRYALQRHRPQRQAHRVYLLPPAAVRRKIYYKGVALLQRHAGGLLR